MAARKVPAKGVVPDKTAIVEVRAIAEADRNRVELRIDLPFGAVLPSSEGPEARAKTARLPVKQARKK
jgi:hypothetical protein